MKIPWTSLCAFVGGLVILSPFGLRQLKDRSVARVSIICGLAFVLFGILSAIEANTTDESDPIGRSRHVLLMTRTIIGGVGGGMFLALLMLGKLRKPTSNK